MPQNFIVRPLAPDVLRDLLSLSPEALKARNIRRRRVDASPGYPCRLSLHDAQVGEEVFELTYEHQPAASPYRAGGPIFIRTEAERARLGPNELPAMLNHRLLSLRGYNAEDIMVVAKVLEGEKLRAAIEELFRDPAVRYLDIHNAAPGCFNCRVERLHLN